MKKDFMTMRGIIFSIVTNDKNWISTFEDFFGDLEGFIDWLKGLSEKELLSGKYELFDGCKFIFSVDVRHIEELGEFVADWRVDAEKSKGCMVL